MRILFTCAFGYSHFYNSAPLALAARDLGHEVAFSSAREAADAVTAAGIPFFPAGPGRLRVRAEILRRHRAEIVDDTRDWRVGARMFGEVAPRLRWRELSDVVARYRPDVIVSEALELAGPLVAEVHGIPHFLLSIGPYHADSWSLLWERAEPLYREVLGRRCGPDDVVEPYLDICPPTLQTAAGRALTDVVRVGLPAYHGDSPGTAPAAAPTGRPRALVTFGTVSNAAVPGMAEAAAALARRGMDVLVTLGPNGWFPDTEPADRTGGGAARGRVRTVAYTPLDRELPTTALLVHHGGSNTSRAAVEFGVPSLMVPQGAEQHRNADWLAAHGLGRVVETGAADPGRLAAEAAALLGDAGVRQRLAAARAAWLAMPGPAEALDAIGRRARRWVAAPR